LTRLHKCQFRIRLGCSESDLPFIESRRGGQKLMQADVRHEGLRKIKSERRDGALTKRIFVLARLSAAFLVAKKLNADCTKGTLWSRS
jgi:hypothetical protein